MTDWLSKCLGKTDFHVGETLFSTFVHEGCKMHKGWEFTAQCKGWKLHSCTRAVKVL